MSHTIQQKKIRGKGSEGRTRGESVVRHRHGRRARVGAVHHDRPSQVSSGPGLENHVDLRSVGRNGAVLEEDLLTLEGANVVDDVAVQLHHHVEEIVVTPVVQKLIGVSANNNNNNAQESRSSCQGASTY